MCSKIEERERESRLQEYLDDFPITHLTHERIFEKCETKVSWQFLKEALERKGVFHYILNIIPHTYNTTCYQRRFQLYLLMIIKIFPKLLQIIANIRSFLRSKFIRHLRLQTFFEQIFLTFNFSITLNFKKSTAKWTEKK